MKKASKRLQKNADFVKNFSNIVRNGPRSINKITKCQMTCLREILQNLMIGNIPISKDSYKKLKLHRKCLFKVCNKRLPLQIQRKHLMGDGVASAAILSVLVSEVIPAVMEFIQRTT